MTKVIRVKTGTKYEEIASYSRLVCVGDQIFVSNTAGRDPETKEMPEGVTEQSYMAISNVERALKAVDSCLEDVVAIRVFVPNPADADAVGQVLGDKFRGIDPASTLTCPPLGSTIYKMEIEVTAIRGASKAEATYITL
ncbi:Rid family hydrolase [Phaeobacter sp. HF9A]|uniref:Rid family hydrolase n=1 Tax=Phaeobacter sp. HF9A TaxID=2721561 RepID=UPI0014304DF3|nr:Rid family hydrolase [Phaeobacter sp. HF9A]NIZ12068.1 RidA family protein [Phaeobacter sp. HF9A]